MVERKKILVIGLGYFMRELVRTLTKLRPCIAVDSNPSTMGEWEGVDNLAIYVGDANSIVLWKKLPLDEVSHIVFSLPDKDVAEELCRIARETFHLDIPIIAIAHGQEPESYAKYNITTVDPLANGIKSVQGLIEKNYAIPSNIGLGKGELIEVTIVRKSHLVDRKLKYMESPRWRVAAIYRNGELVLPNGDSYLTVGDKVLLAGAPQVLTNIVNILMQGIPRFPLQYGEFINTLMGTPPAPMEEANYVRFFTQAVGIKCFGTDDQLHKAERNDIIASMDPLYTPLPPSEGYKTKELFSNAGIVVVDAPQTFSMLNRKMVYFMRNATSPVLFAKGAFPYSHIILSLNSVNPAYVLQVAMELSRLSGIALKTIYVTAPKTLRNAMREEELADRQRIVRDFENIERVKVDYTVIEGNPVKKTVEFQKDYPKALLVIGNNRSQRVSLFEPHIPFLLCERLATSLLVIPVGDYGVS